MLGLYITLGLLALLFALYVFSLKGRKGHKDMRKLRKFVYAHRGLHKNDVPENSLWAFQLARDKGYGIELDVHLMKDGQLAVIHDTSLLRTAGVDIRIDEIGEEDLNSFRLEGTEERIPLFRQVLELYRGYAPLIIELKTDRGNHAELCRAVCEMLKDYQGLYCIESFDPRCIAWLKKNRPDIVRGQLSENFLKTGYMPFFLRPIMAWNMTTFLTKPDFIAYRFADRKCFSIYVMRKLWKIQGVTWTLRTKEEYELAHKEGWIPIFENFEI